MIFLLAVVAAFGMISPATGIFQTWWFAGLGLVFLVNLSACTLQQAINSYRLWSRRNALIKIDHNMDESILSDKDFTDSIQPIMSRQRYKCIFNGAGVTLWTKGRFGIWGATLFHVGLIIITLGALVSGTMKMSGHIRVAEGEIRFEQHQEYEGIEEGPFFDEGEHRGFGISLLKQNIVLGKNGDVDDIISDIAILENGQVARQASLGEKESLIYRGIRIFEQEAGFAPFIEIAGPNKEILFRTYVLLDSKTIGDKTQFYLENLPVPNTKYRASLHFYPDMVQQGGKTSTGKYTLSNPAAVVSVFDGDYKIAEKIIKPGGFLDFAGYRFRLGDIRHWNGYDIVNDRGANLVFAGSWAAIAGLILMYLMPYKKIQIQSSPQGAGLQVLGVTNRVRKPFEEELAKLRARFACHPGEAGVWSK